MKSEKLLNERRPEGVCNVVETRNGAILRQQTIPTRDRRPPFRGLLRKRNQGNRQANVKGTRHRGAVLCGTSVCPVIR